MTEKASIPLAEERLLVEKTKVSDGEVVVSSKTDFVRHQADIELERTEVDVERVPVDIVVNAPPAMRTEGDVTIIPVVEERLVVEKRLVLVEEIHIRRRTLFQEERVEAELRKQRVTVERINADEAKEKQDG